nr:Ubiquitin-associated protein like [Ipomoea batatas]
MAFPPSSTAPPPQPAQPHRPSALYPRISQFSANPIAAVGIGIRVALKPEYRMTPLPHLSPQLEDVPRSVFNFEFDVERKILAEAEKDNPNCSELTLGNIPQERTDQTDPGSSEDPIVNTYIASGLNREAVPLAVANYGDDPTKVKEFVEQYSRVKDMGFSSNDVAESLLLFHNDIDQALQHLLSHPS